MAQTKRSLEDIIQLDPVNGTPAPEPEPDPKPETQKRSYPSREGKVPVQFFVNKDAHRQLKIICAETDQTNQDIMRDALNNWFLMNDKPPIA